MNKNNPVVVRHEQTVSYSGPLPAPSDLQRFEQILPGAAERIMKMAEQQAVHRRQLETQVISSGVRKSERGLVFGLIIGITAIVTGGVCASLGQQIAASFIGGGGIVGLVSVFVIGSQQQKSERIQKEKLMQEEK